MEIFSAFYWTLINSLVYLDNLYSLRNYHIIICHLQFSISVVGMARQSYIP